MTYKATARLLGQSISSRCDNGTLSVSAGHRQGLTLVIAAGTNYEESHGDLAHDFSFRGSDPGPYVESTVKAASRKSVKHLKHAHVTDYCTLSDAFVLNLPDPHDSSKFETAELIADYKANSSAGNPYLESLMFDFGRHLFISSSRPGGLPPNLQGVWAQYLSNAWGADYHANINLQMNHWGVDQTGLGSLQGPLWDYMDKTWAPRGNETAELLYAAPGWVTHNEMNIFGHTGMKMGDAIWADYPASAAWMMQHVCDHYEYSRDVQWLKEQGYPRLLKPIAKFWASQLQEDQYFEDGTLVVNPCTSPEHGPTTFGKLIFCRTFSNKYSGQSLMTPSRLYALPTTDLPSLCNCPPVCSGCGRKRQQLHLVFGNTAHSLGQRPSHRLVGPGAGMEAGP